ncbi:MAG: 4a-hydroxytetrahydrobiopterin dehydratase [Thermoleophilia bacterium]|nr:4a-hydroxytetrahydrobiopterin dehydratase [Thermoleophilia bacterium]
MPPLDPDAVTRALGDLPGWRHDGDAIVKDFTFDGFAGAVLFVNRLAGAAEEADHHPDLDIRWNRVVVRWSTHSEGGVTRRDLELAARSDALA